MIEIRTAKPEHAEQIAKVHVKSWQTTYQKIINEEYLSTMRWEDRVGQWKQTLEDLNENVIILGAFKHDQLIGFISGGSSRTHLNHYDAEIYAIYLLKEFRGIGVGEKLIKHFFKWLKKKGFHSCIVWIAEKNPYQSFYAKLGAAKTDYKGVVRVHSTKIPTVAYLWDKI